MPTNANVTITYDTSADPPRLVLSPVSANITGAGTATWTAANCGATIVFASKGGQYGPFPPKNTPDNPSAGMYNCDHGSVTSNPASLNTNGTWTYTATLVTTDKNPPETDGTVVVKENP